MREDLLFAFNAVGPIIFTVAIGYILKRIGLIGPDLAKAAHKLVFRAFLPILLFVNILGIEDFSNIRLGYVLYSVIGIALLFAVGLPIVLAFTKKREHRGVMLQAVFRSNYAFVGIPLATSLGGAEGALIATLLSVVLVPTINIFSVIALSLFSDTGRVSVKKILVGIAKNPLIVGISAGIVYLILREALAAAGIFIDITESGAIWGTLKNLSNLATPLALVMLGAQFEFSAISALKREIIFSTLAKCLVAPILGIGIAAIAFRDNFLAAEYASIVAVFATPVSISSVPMSQEMGADSSLAGQIVVFTTIFSALTIFTASFVLKTLGIF